MPLTAGDVINAARDAHPALTKEYAPSAVGWRFLTRWQRVIAAEATRLVPEFLNETKSVPYADSYLSAGLNLLSPTAPTLWPGGLLEVKRVVATVAAQPTFYGQREVKVLPFLSELVQFSVPTAVLENATTLRLLGEPQDWSPYDTLDITVTPTPPAITADATPLVLPDDALDAAAMALAAFYVQRLALDPAFKASAPGAGMLATNAAEARLAFLLRVQQQQSRQPLRIQEVW